MPAHRLEAVVGGVPPSTRDSAGDSSEPLSAAVAALVGPARYNLWFQGHARFVNLGAEVIVVARNESGRDWLEHTFGEAVKAAAADVCGTSALVRWVVDPAAFPPPSRGTEAPLSSPSEPPKDLFGEPVPAPKPKAAPKPDPEAQDFDRPTAAQRTGRKWKHLSDFVVGSSNRVAHASALAAVDEPGQGANPIVFHGPTGTGKTHLLEGIFCGLRRRLDAKPVYTTAEEFTTRFVQASRLGKMSAFRRQYRECSALLLDNLNFLATKRATQEEFLHTFDALVADGRQVVVTTDCHPKLADELMPELVDRLIGGAVWSLLPPDTGTRLEILRKKSEIGRASCRERV